METQNDLILFEASTIRKIWHQEEWWFSIIDIINILAESNNPQSYWGKLKEREPQLLTICQKFKFLASDGKMRSTDCANTEGVLRIVMSVPSPKAEPLKLWLAEQGKRSIDETENPELSFERMTEIYKAKGRTDEWITRRVESIKARKRLTDEWKARGITENKDYSILTATIAKGTFDLTPSEHRDLKGLTDKNQELRDHMTPLELIFTALGEEMTRQIAIKEDTQGFNENHDAAVKGGTMAGKARKLIEAESGEKVVSKENYLPKGNESVKELPE